MIFDNRLLFRQIQNYAFLRGFTSRSAKSCSRFLSIIILLSVAPVSARSAVHSYMKRISFQYAGSPCVSSARRDTWLRDAATKICVAAGITFEPMRRLMQTENISYYRLANEGIDAQTLQRIRHDRPVTTETLGKLCAIMHCQPGDLIEYLEEENQIKK